jgi:hypothetical protein
MRKVWIGGAIVGAVLALAGMVMAQSFTDVNTPQYYGKTGIPAAYSVIDANFALIESGTVDGSFDELTVNNTLTAISTNDATTNVIITVNGAVDGETIADDTIDEDSIDFTDVTGADLTLTDCTDITASGAISLTDTGAAGDAVITATGGEAKEGQIKIEADNGDDPDDTVILAVDTSGNLDIRGTDGTNDVVVIDASTGTIDADGNLIAKGGQVYLASNDEYFDVINTTQLVFIANNGATTNVIDADITN